MCHLNKQTASCRWRQSHTVNLRDEDLARTPGVSTCAIRARSCAVQAATEEEALTGQSDSSLVVSPAEPLCIRVRLLSAPGQNHWPGVPPLRARGTAGTPAPSELAASC